MLLIDVLGYVGSLTLAWCGLPQAIKCYKEKSAKGLSAWFIWMWIFGEIMVWTYLWMKNGTDIPVIINYGSNVILGFTIAYFKYFGADVHYNE